VRQHCLGYVHSLVILRLHPKNTERFYKVGRFIQPVIGRSTIIKEPRMCYNIEIPRRVLRVFFGSSLGRLLLITVMMVVDAIVDMEPRKNTQGSDYDG
jgi:hypothetical protein